MTLNECEPGTICRSDDTSVLRCRSYCQLDNPDACPEVGESCSPLFEETEEISDEVKNIGFCKPEAP